MRNKKILLGALLAFIILRIPSLFEPHWYADEGIYAAITYGIESGKLLYVNLWDNKPMLIYWLYGLGNPTNRIFVVKFINLLAGGMSLVGLHILLQYFKLSKRTLAIALGVAVILIGTPLIEGNIVNAENLFIPLVIFGYISILRKNPLYALSGLLFGLGFMLKFHPLFDYSAAILFLFVTRHKFRNICLSIVFFALPNILQYIYLYFNGNLIQAFQTIFLNNYGYTQSFSYGVRSLPLKTLFLSLWLALLIYQYYQENISKKMLFILFLVSFEAYAVLFGARQYLHYMFQLIPGAILLFALLYQYVFSSEGIHKARYTSYSIAALLIFLRIFFYGEGTAVPQNVPSYYAQFVEFSVGKKPYFLFPTEESLQNVQHTLEKYQTKNIFFYTNNPWIYDVLHIVPPAIIVAGYHRTFIGIDLFMNTLIDAKTDVIVMDINADNCEELNTYLSKEYIRTEQVENYDVWVRAQR